MKLTEEQALVVEKNHSLIYWYAHMNHLDLENWYDILALELCYTVLKYEEEKGSLATYYKVRCDGIVRKEYRKSQAQKRLHESVLYIEEEHKNEIDDNIDDIISEMEYRDFIDSDDSNILRLKQNGYNQNEIATMLNVSQSFVSQRLKKLRKEFKSVYR